ncbi:hypothetical protein SCHPADRAFT_904351 [Schizopora paradoxa]|uniref:Programmed cell death protein 2 C-terminal domain-containing protein n=1 Tax=Schizopora paradoxa TaxID=27342 RepID=A0A0H2RN21_9AGAM|nr:hypothetical protein SCHPADRAFT_904351 [Schizopora paradoxa]
MAPRDPDEYDSDSENESLEEIETSVLLGLPDGPIESQNDVDDAAVSRIGGYPAFLTSEPPIESAQCRVCSSPMELLVQLWCPFEESTMDRALYVFGCSRGGCQKKVGSVRAYRGLRYNKEYAAKLEQKRQKAKEKEAAKAKAAGLEAQAKEKAKINPFSMGNTSTPSGLFGGSFGAPAGLGSQLFGASQQEESPQTEQAADHDDGEEAEAPPASDEEPEDEDEEDDSDSESTPSVVEALTSRVSEASPWSKQPGFKPPLYLSTSMEYIPPPPKMPQVPSAEEILDERDREGKGNKSKDEDGWNSAMEGYENSLNMDHVFERFATRTSYEGEQCIRYELGGTPLPYASDAVFSALFPSPTSGVTQVTGGHLTVTPTPPKRVYDPDSSSINRCDRCGVKRKFECQLMPNLINILRASSDAPATDKKKQQSDAERKEELEKLLKGGAAMGMEWGTCMVFSCEKDCCLSGDGKEAKESWSEELVLVQWEE